MTNEKGIPRSETTNSRGIPAPVTTQGGAAVPEKLSAGLQHHQAGRLQEAEQIYRRFLKEEPDNALALEWLGVIAAQNGNGQAAIQLLTRAIRLVPGRSDAYFSLGTVLIAQGGLTQAVNAYTHAAVLGHPQAWIELDALYKRLTQPERARSLRMLTELLIQQGRPREALNTACDLIRLDPDDPQNWVPFGRCLMPLRFNSPVSDYVMETLSLAFSRDDVDHDNMVRAAASALKHEPAFDVLFSINERGTELVDRFVDRIPAGEFTEITGNPLLRRMLDVALVSDHDLERGLTALRHAFLILLTRDRQSTFGDIAHRSFLCSLANQCFLNEFVFAKAAEEHERVGRLRARIREGLNAGGDVPPTWVAMLAAYEPLHRLDFASLILGRSWSLDLESVITRHIREPQEEARLQERIPRLTPIEPGVSSAVRSQYEENAFPRWLTVPPVYMPVPLNDIVRGIFPHLRNRVFNHSREPQVLVAGCGTGLIPIILALQIKGASVTAVDLSLTSLGYAQRKTNELGLKNIEYGQADILNLSALNRQFDHVNCFGVLHHLEDPLAGWRVLVDLVKPSCTMCIGLYSKAARQCVDIAGKVIADRGYSSSPEDMRRCRQELLTLAEEVPELHPITDSLAFFSMSNFRDYVFHVQEHCLTITQLGEMISSLGLEFLGFELTEPGVAQRYRARFPQDASLTNLELWDRFEADNPMTFQSTYRFWVRKSA